MKNNNQEKPITKEQLVGQFRRAEILKAARQIFAEQGFRKATIDMIAERAKIAKGTIYLYFRNKEQLFLQALEERLNSMLKGVLDIIQEKGEPLQKIKNLISFVFRFLDKDKDFFRIFHTSAVECYIRDLSSHVENIMGYLKKFFDSVTPTLKEAIDSGLLIQMQPLKMAFILGGIIDYFIMYRIMTNEPQPFSVDEELAYEIFLNGFLRKEN
jgi:AcrR family transcriptional regulator